MLTRAEYEGLIDSGFFAAQRCELVGGELIDKMGQSPRHAWVLNHLAARLMQAFGPRVQAQLPLHVTGSDHEWSLLDPDVTLLCERKAEFNRRHPRSDEAQLVIEVADSSARFDLGAKRDLYARAGVVEYWVLDLNRRLLVIHREPQDGFYAHVDILSDNGVAAIGDLIIPVSEMFA